MFFLKFGYANIMQYFDIKKENDGKKFFLPSFII